MTLTKEEMRLMRSALCTASTKALSRAFKTQEELEELGRDDTYLVELEMRIHEMYQGMIKKLDKELEVEA